MGDIDDRYSMKYVRKVGRGDEGMRWNTSTGREEGGEGWGVG